MAAVVSPKHRPHFTPQKSLSEPQGLVQLEGLGELNKFFQLIGSSTRDLPVVIGFLILISVFSKKEFHYETLICSHKKERKKERERERKEGRMTA
jgi:hypothetical protein